jgi:hypothetical protein
MNRTAWLIFGGGVVLTLAVLAGIGLGTVLASCI